MVLLLMISFELFCMFQKSCVRWISYLSTEQLKHDRYFYINETNFVLLGQKMCWGKAVLKNKISAVIKNHDSSDKIFSFSEDNPLIQT